jgi:hypothetical protein
MNKTLDDEIYQNREVRCRKCHRVIFRTAFDAQVLLIENSRLAVFGFMSWQCVCGKSGRFLSPNLPEEKKTLDNEFPDSKQIEHRAAGIAKGVSKGDNGKFRARIIVNGQTKYLGYYDSIEAASAAYSKAKTRFQV